MAIEINGLPHKTVNKGGKSETKSVAQQPNNPAQQSASQVPTDALTLTETAVKLQALKSSMSTIPDINQERVDRLKQAIADGKYKIDSTSIADKFIKLEKSLFS